jgi:hypothetical protein
MHHSLSLLNSEVKWSTIMDRRMPSYGILRRVALVTTDVGEKLIDSIIRVTIFGNLGITSN